MPKKVIKVNQTPYYQPPPKPSLLSPLLFDITKVKRRKRGRKN